MNFLINYSYNGTKIAYIEHSEYNMTMYSRLVIWRNAQTPGIL